MKILCFTAKEPRFCGSFSFLTWEQRKFGKVVNRSTEMACLSELPRVEYEDIISGIGLLNKDITKKQSNKSGLLFSQGDVLYGKLRPYLKNWLIPSFSGIAVGDFWVLKPENSDSGFIYRLIQTKQFDNVANQSTGTKMPRADWKLVSNTMFYVPILITEQVKIGRCFSVLDNLITLHQCKEISLFLQKMQQFVVEKMAFAWEQRKLGELAVITKGQQINKSKLGLVGKYYVLNGGMTPSGYTDTYNTKANTISISEGGNSCGYVNFNFEPFWSGGHNYTLLNPHINVNYLYQILKYIEPQIMALRVGSGLPNVQKSRLEELEIIYPIFTEQEKIGLYFEKIDNLITLHQCEFRQIFHFIKQISRMRRKQNLARDWEQCKLGENVSIIMGQSPDGSTYSDKPNDYILVQGNADLENGWVKPRVWTTQKTKLGSAGDLIMSVRAPAGSMGKTRFDVVLGRGVAAIKGNEFIYQLLVKKDIDGYWKRLSAGSTFESLNSDTIYNAEIVIPEQEEQKRIGELFEYLDNLITLHQCKDFSFLSSQKYKFHFENTNQKATTWEQRQVGELLFERNQKAPMSEEYPLMAFIANEGVAPKGERYDRSALVTDTETKLYKKTEFGDFIYSSNNLETGSIGLNKYGKASISPVYSIFEPTGIADSDFLGRRLVRKDFINAMVKWRQGVIYGQWRIHESDFIKIEIAVPKVDEQRKIGVLLDRLDNLITLHQRVLIKY